MGAIRHTKQQKEDFLAKFAEFGRIDLAALATGINRTTHYAWMQDLKYRRRFEAARDQAIQMLADEAHRRAYEGVSRPVMHKGEAVNIDGKPLHEITYSDTLLIFLMKAADPKRYRDNVAIQHTGKDGDPLFDAASIRAYMQSQPDRDAERE